MELAEGRLKKSSESSPHRNGTTTSVRKDCQLTLNSQELASPANPAVGLEKEEQPAKSPANKQVRLNHKS